MCIRDRDSFSIEVTNVNNAPTIDGTPDAEVEVDASYSFTPDADDADGDTLTYSISDKPGWADFDEDTGALTGTLTNADIGTYSNIVISVSDGVETAALDSFSIEVTNVNDAPTISGSPEATVAQDASYSFTLLASDADGDTLTYSISGRPAWACLLYTSPSPRDRTRSRMPSSA